MNARKPLIADDALDPATVAFLDAKPRAAAEPAEKPAPTPKPRKTASAKQPEPEPEKPASQKTRATFHLPAELVDEARDAVIALAGPPEHLTLAALVERALRVELERLKRKHNGGAPFQMFKRKLKGGRPVSR